MNYSSIKLQIQDKHRQLEQQWKHLNQNWSDVKADEFRKEYLKPLEQNIRLSLSAIEEMEQIFQQIKEDCC